MSTLVSSEQATMLTVNDLSKKLKHVRYMRFLDKKYNNHIKPARPYIHKNDPVAAVNYFNKYLSIGIDTRDPIFMDEDLCACSLFDLANLPIEMVINRLNRDGVYTY